MKTCFFLNFFYTYKSYCLVGQINRMKIKHTITIEEEEEEEEKEHMIDS
jgi:hypothetical protein